LSHKAGWAAPVAYLFLFCSKLAFLVLACSKSSDPAPPVAAAAAAPALLPGRIPVDVQLGPFGLDCALDAAITASPLTRTHLPIAATKDLAAKIVGIPALGVRLPFPKSEFDEFPPEVLVTPAELLGVRTSSAEWSYVYASLAESALPFEALLLQLGEESFVTPTTFTSLTVRLYALEQSLDQVMPEATRRATAAAARIVCDPGQRPASATPIETKTDTIGVWQRTVVSVRVWYGDYGGIAHVEMRAHRRAGVTLVLVAFNEAPHSAELDRIAKSLE
jgi:hypothetical protein